MTEPNPGLTEDRDSGGSVPSYRRLLLFCLLASILQCARSGDVLFSDNFTGSRLDKWVPLRGEWQLQDGLLLQQDFSRPAFTASASELWEDYALELKAMRPDSALDGFLIVLRFPGSADAIEWTIGGWCDSLSALQRRPGFPTTYSDRYDETVRPCSIGTGRWYDIRAEVRGQSIKCWLDGVLMVDYSSPDFETLSPSRIALGSWRNRACFDDVVVTRLD